MDESGLSVIPTLLGIDYNLVKERMSIEREIIVVFEKIVRKIICERFAPKELCVGCLSCVNSCTHQAIEFEKDVCGFRYPIIDQEKCVDCGLCGFVCPVNHPPEKYFPKECYAVTVKSERELFSCASGGAATAIARHVLNTGGVVYGCSGMDIRHVRHVRISGMEELNLLKGSKYVQSDLGLTFKQIRGDLKVGKEVLFVGTPCQVGGLKTYLRKD